MMRSTSQSGLIADKIMFYLNAGISNKEEILTKVVDDLKVPRPTVRRVKKDLILILQEYIRVLANNA